MDRINQLLLPDDDWHGGTPYEAKLAADGTVTIDYSAASGVSSPEAISHLSIDEIENYINDSRYGGIASFEKSLTLLMKGLDKAGQARLLTTINDKLAEKRSGGKDNSGYTATVDDKGNVTIAVNSTKKLASLLANLSSKADFETYLKAPPPAGGKDQLAANITAAIKGLNKEDIDKYLAAVKDLLPDGYSLNTKAKDGGVVITKD